METNPENLAELLRSPGREAHRQIHAQLEASQQPGQAFYFPNGGPIERRPDFLVALEGKTYFSLYVAAQPHSVEDGRLMIVSGAGGPPTQSPVGHAASHAVAIGKELKPKLGYRIYVIPVALFMDEGPDNAVQAWAIEHGIATLFTADCLVERLVNVVREHHKPIFHPPGGEEIRKVMAYFNSEDKSPAVIASDPVGDLPPEAGISARQVIIQRADTVNVYTTGYTPGSDVVDGP